MFYLNSTLNFGILPVLVFQLEVYYKVDRLLTGVTAQQKGTTARWYSNKTSLVLFLVNLYIDFRKFSCHPYLRSKNTRSRRLRLRSWDMSNNDHIFHRLHWNIDWCGQRKGQELNKSHQAQNILLSNLGTRCQGRDTELRLAHTQLTPTT